MIYHGCDIEISLTGLNRLKQRLTKINDKSSSLEQAETKKSSF